MKANKIKDLLKKNGFTQKSLADFIGVSENGLKKMFDTDRYKLDTLNKIAEYLKIDVSELIGNPTKVLLTELTIKKIDSNISKPVPYYDEINTSAGISLITENTQIKPIKYIDIPNSGSDFFINVYGDSMYPKYCSGEIVGLKRVDKEYVMPGHAYVVELKSGDSYLKYIKNGKDSEHWLLVSENKFYDNKEIHVDKIKAVYMIKIVLTKTSI